MPVLEEKVTNRAVNFNAGPSALPLEVLERARDEMVTFGDAGLSVMEMSHRSKDFEAILNRAEEGLRKNLGVSDSYAVLFLGGGATTQFSMMPMNFARKGRPVDVIHTGSWTKKAMDEMNKVAEFRIAGSSEKEKFTKIPDFSSLQLNSKASYVHVCSNNTITGTEYFSFPDTGSVPLVADMSSDIASKPVNVEKFGAIFAGAQKNLGPAGVTVVILRKEWAETGSQALPPMLQYRTHIKTRSLYNTPPAYGIYMVALVQEWIARQGGVAALEKKNAEKAALLYDAIDGSDFYACPVEKKSRSRMNVVFRIKKGDEELEAKFVGEAKKAGMIGLKGHRSVGGLRASLYNAQTKAGVQTLVSFMADFKKKAGSSRPI